MSANMCVCCGRIIPEGSHICLLCGSENEMQTFNLKSKKPKTNGDKIRQMTDEELAIQLEAFICHNVKECRAEDISCIDCALKWLKQEVRENVGSN